MNSPSPVTRWSVSELRQAARFAMTLVTEQARVCQRLIRLVELGFPELGELFDDPACRTAREVLRVAPTAAAARKRRTSTLADANAGPGHRRLGETKAQHLKAAAATSIAVSELDDEVAFEVGLLLDQYDLLERQIAEAEEHVASLLDGELARRLQTIPGVGPATCAALIAEIGDIWRFDDVDQLLAYAGVHPAERSSGRRVRTPRPPGTCPRPATRTSAPPPTAWPWWVSPTTPSSGPTTSASVPPARAR